MKFGSLYNKPIKIPLGIHTTTYSPNIPPGIHKTKQQSLMDVLFLGKFGSLYIKIPKYSFCGIHKTKQQSLMDVLFFGEFQESFS
jgi:hypothetical protein